MIPLCFVFRPFNIPSTADCRMGGLFWISSHSHRTDAQIVGRYTLLSGLRGSNLDHVTQFNTILLNRPRITCRDVSPTSAGSAESMFAEPSTPCHCHFASFLFLFIASFSISESIDLELFGSDFGPPAKVKRFVWAKWPFGGYFPASVYFRFTSARSGGRWTPVNQLAAEFQVPQIVILADESLEFSRFISIMMVT